MSPRVVPLPNDGQFDDVLSAMQVLGNTVNIRIVQFLAKRENAHLGEIIEGTGLKRPTLGIHLRQLEEIRVIKADLPPELRHGRSISYSIDKERIQSLADQHLEFMLG